MIEDNTLSDFAHRLDQWFILAADPGTRRVDGLTKVSLAELFGRHRETIAAALDELAEHGRIKFDLPRGRGTGWVEVLGYDDRLAYNARTAELRTDAYLAGDREPPRQMSIPVDNCDPEMTPTADISHGETPRSFCDSLGVPKRRVPAGTAPARLHALPARLRRVRAA